MTLKRNISLKSTQLTLVQLETCVANLWSKTTVTTSMAIRLKISMHHHLGFILAGTDLNVEFSNLVKGQKLFGQFSQQIKLLKFIKIKYMFRL